MVLRGRLSTFGGGDGWRVSTGDAPGVGGLTMVGFIAARCCIVRSALPRASRSNVCTPCHDDSESIRIVSPSIRVSRYPLPSRPTSASTSLRSAGGGQTVASVGQRGRTSYVAGRSKSLTVNASAVGSCEAEDDGKRSLKSVGAVGAAALDALGMVMPCGA